jgi:very-short-patch-repair endonuclease
MDTRAKPSPGCLSPRGELDVGSEGSEIEASLPTSVRLVDGRQLRLARGLGIDARITALAEQQRGRVSRRQLLCAGVKRAAINRRLENGRLVLVYAGVYAMPHALDVALGAETAAVLACGEGALLSHHCAVTLWKLRPGIARPIHVTIARDSPGRKLAGVTIHRSSTLVAADARVHRGLPVTSPARALLDVAGSLPDRDVERLLDEGVFALRILTMAEVRDVLARAGNHPGRARLARIADGHTRSTRTESPPEEQLLALIRAAGLPEPRPGVSVLGYRLDFLWPGLRLAVEVDAYGTHGSRARFEADRRRDARLLSEKGIVVLRVTKLAIETRPLEVVAMLARAVAQREAELRAG